MGDEGGAYDIGCKALRAAVRAADGRALPTELLPALLQRLDLDEPELLIGWSRAARKLEIAALAPLVIDVAAAGDQTAGTIIASAVSALGDHVAALLDVLAPWSEPPPLALAGGLLAPGGPLRLQLLEALGRYSCRPVGTTLDAARGAAQLALSELAGGC